MKAVLYAMTIVVVLWAISVLALISLAQSAR